MKRGLLRGITDARLHGVLNNHQTLIERVVVYGAAWLVLLTIAVVYLAAGALDAAR